MHCSLMRFKHWIKKQYINQRLVGLPAQPREKEACTKLLYQYFDSAKKKKKKKKQTNKQT